MVANSLDQPLVNYGNDNVETGNKTTDQCLLHFSNIHVILVAVAKARSVDKVNLFRRVLLAVALVDAMTLQVECRLFVDSCELFEVVLRCEPSFNGFAVRKLWKLNLHSSSLRKC